MKLLILLITTCLLCSCSQLYYGYLPGTDYKILEPQRKVDLKGKSFDIQFVDSRDNVSKISCSDHDLDRNTELEGELGANLFRQSVLTMVRQSNGKIDPHSPNKLVVELEVESFVLIGAGYIVPHGFTQFKVTSPFLSKRYCTDMSDHDDDSPLKWYSFATRKSASRLIVSGATRRTAEQFVKDLADSNI
ncbi:hypothetical protein M1B72_08845 [Geomonas paludis]|uniref:Lipoprotein n=1 Tax=Geomonas paludis TaxID=2740185 RepID=A0ABY4LIV7_9BACT|nr:hypothetical protein [Geomonas paludis]UPU37797.1 hypothetical protein M1B72_08845 [Geomonas paludis]